MLQKLSTNFVMGYAFNLCKKGISIVRYNQNIRKRRNRYGAEQSSDRGCGRCVRS